MRSLEHFDASDIFFEERHCVEHEHLRLGARDEAGALVAQVVVEGERVLRPPLDDLLVRLQLAVDPLGGLQPRLGEQDEVGPVLLRDVPEVEEEEVADEGAAHLVEVEVVGDGLDVEVLGLLLRGVVVRGDAPVPDLVGIPDRNCGGNSINVEVSLVTNHQMHVLKCC